MAPMNSLRCTDARRGRAYSSRGRASNRFLSMLPEAIRRLMRAGGQRQRLDAFAGQLRWANPALTVGEIRRDHVVEVSLRVARYAVAGREREVERLSGGDVVEPEDAA